MLALEGFWLSMNRMKIFINSLAITLFEEGVFCAQLMNKSMISNYNLIGTLGYVITPLLGLKLLVVVL